MFAVCSLGGGPNYADKAHAFEWYRMMRQAVVYYNRLIYYKAIKSGALQNKSISGG